MVGYRGDDNLSTQDFAFAGAFAGAVTRATVSPLDVLKIRFQLQLENARPNVNRALQERTPKYTSLIQSVRLILREEGIRAFWKGHIPGQLLSVVYGIVQFSTFEYCTWSLSVTTADWKKPGVHFICGGMSGCVATLCVQPLDLLRTRLVAQGEPKIYRNSVHAALIIFQREGGKSFYKGLVPTLLQIFPHAGCQFGFYELFRIIWKLSRDSTHIHSPDVAISESLFCGASAGICSKAIIYPLDLLKKRLQIQGFEIARIRFGVVQRYNSLRHALQLILRDEGILGLYKGFIPSVLKAGVSVGVTFASYELCCNFIRSYKTWTPYIV